MPFSEPPQRVPLHRRDLDALSADELEALLFDEAPPSRRSGFARLPAAVGLLSLGLGLFGLFASRLWHFGAGLTQGALVDALLLLSALLVGRAGWRLLFARSGVPARARRASESRRLTRSKHDRKLMGVCGGLADYFGAEATPVRLGFIAGLLVTGVLPTGLAYLLMAYALPSAPPSARAEPPRT